MVHNCTAFLWSIPICLCCVWMSVSCYEGVHLTCCDAVSGNCRAACHKITLLDLATKPERHKLFKAHLDHHCSGSRYFDHFMACFNNTTKELHRGENWTGRECCVFARDPRCRVACIYAQSRQELEPICWESKEEGLYKCIQFIWDAESCCALATAKQNLPCQKFCTSLLPASSDKPSLSYADLILLHSKCADSLETVHCAWRLVDAPVDHLDCASCCNSSSKTLCQETCTEVSAAFESGVVAIEKLIASGCGRPDPQETFWTCLLAKLDIAKSTAFAVSDVVSNPDAMKLRCCLKALTIQCRRACFQAYGPSGTSEDAERFVLLCVGSWEEEEFLLCLRDVTMPCQLGCSNMNFCSHFNQKRSYYFRACNGASDGQAQLAFDVWNRDGHVTLNNQTISLKFDKKCSRVWRGLLCALSAKPCNPQHWSIPLCYSKCVEIAMPCLSPSWRSTAEAFCNHILPPEYRFRNITPYCLNIDVPEAHPTEIELISLYPGELTPCYPNPCPAGSRCEMRQNLETNEYGHVCIPGCIVSEVGFPYVITKDDVLVTPSLAEDQVAYTACKCGADGNIGSCVDLPFSEQLTGCWLDLQYYEHGSRFQKACSRCVCFSGELICSAGYCIAEAQRDEERNTLTGLPCSCPMNFNRVCGSNGKTYPTECSARCSGLSQYDFTGGFCALDHSCPKADCGPDKWCLERSEVCLDHTLPCPQYACVDVKTNCWEQLVDIACDDSGMEHDNLCGLLLEGKTFAYMGRCLDSCKRTGAVCGHNAETFPSQCAALAEHVGIDYDGRCITVGGRIEEGLLNTCEVAYKLCVKPVRQDCIGLVPPDACCPICGGGLRVLFSPLRVRRLVEKNIVTVSTRRILTRLQKLITSSLCQVSGYLTMENDVAVIVTVSNKTAEEVTSEDVSPSF